MLRETWKGSYDERTHEKNKALETLFPCWQRGSMSGGLNAVRTLQLLARAEKQNEKSSQGFVFPNIFCISSKIPASITAFVPEN